MPSDAARGRMRIRVRCGACGHKQKVTAEGTPAETACRRCRRDIPLTWSEAVATDREVDVCPVCQGRDFYVHKDLNRNLGLTAVVIVALISVVLLYYDRVEAAYGILFVFALVDLVIYQLLTFVTVCYRCRTEFRGVYRRTAPYFDLHTAEKLELEYSRRLQAERGDAQEPGSAPADTAGAASSGSADSSS